MASKKTPVAEAASKTASKKPGTALVPWEAEMAARAERAKKQEVPYSAFKKLSTQGGILKVDDEPVEGNSLRIIVIGSLHENQYYSGPFDPRAPTVPDCYAFNDPDAEGKPEETMHAHPEAENPQGQEDPNEQEGAAGNACEGCWANVMGSADTGRGKACKNIRRLALVTEDALESAEALADAEVRMLNVPVMSVRNWSKFVNKVADEMSRDPSGVVVELSVVPDPKSQFVLHFDFQELVNFDQPMWEAMEVKRADVMKSLLSAYPKQADLDAQKAAQPARPVRPVGKAAQAMKRVAAKGAAAKKAAPARTGKF